MQTRLSLFGLFAALALQTYASDFLVTNAYRVVAGQTVTGEQWVATGIAETDGIFKDDLFISCGGPLALNGTYEGNIWGAAGGGAVMGGRCARNVRRSARRWPRRARCGASSRPSL